MRLFCVESLQKVCFEAKKIVSANIRKKDKFLSKFKVTLHERNSPRVLKLSRRIVVERLFSIVFPHPVIFKGFYLGDQ